jgi:hypothetical protein
MERGGEKEGRIGSSKDYKKSIQQRREEKSRAEIT